MPAPQSPDIDVFSTPPTTPRVSDTPDPLLTHSLARRNSRPSNLRIEQTADWTPDILLEEQSPDFPKNKTPSQFSHSERPHNYLNGNTMPAMSPNTTVVPIPARQPSAPSRLQSHSDHPVKSPCFIHSHLDMGASLTDWLKRKSNRHQDSFTGPGLGVAKSLQHTADANQLRELLEQREVRHKKNGEMFGISYPDGTMSDSPPLEDDDDDDMGGSLTKQLAETAVGVREMSKQLGRARIHSNIQNVLIVTKARDNRLIKLTRELAIYLMTKKRNGDRGLVVYVDNQLRHSRRFDATGIEREYPELLIPFPRRRASNSSSSSSSNASTSSPPRDEAFLREEGQLRYWTADMCSRSPHLFDFVVTLGGDGTVLFTSWLFQRIVPPVLPFALGSLGFLTNFDFADHQSVMDNVIDDGIRVNLRMRFTCTVYRAVAPDKETSRRKAIKKADTGEILMKNLEKKGWEAIEGGWSIHNPVADGKDGCKAGKDKEIMCFSTRPVESFEVLNDLVVDRGPSPYVSLLELFGDDHHLTTVQADGLAISTPTGSTAYSMSAGGSLVHPEIPAILITPLCPHTLSFRPMLVPDSMEVRICVPFNSRSTAWASFDGRGRVELKQGDHIKVTASKYPFPTVCADKQSTDWFHAISRTLKWNERERQKSFVVVEESPAKASKRAFHKSHVDDNGHPLPDSVEEGEEEEEEIEDFDINDLSSAETEGDAADRDAAVKPVVALSSEEHRLGRTKVRENDVQQAAAEAAVDALSRGNPFMSHLRSLSTTRSGLHSGIETPDRYAAGHPHPPPPVSSRHVQFKPPLKSNQSSSDSIAGEAQMGARDNILSPPSEWNDKKSKIPRDRDIDMEKTPTIPQGKNGHHHTRHKAKPRSRSVPRELVGGSHRAFACWGQDESDTSGSASDTDEPEVEE